MQENTQNQKSDPSIPKLWRSFRRRVKSDSHAADLIFKELIEASLLICPCGSCQFDRESGARTCFCIECGMKIWFTSNLFFRRAQLLRAYLAAIYFQQNDTVITPTKFAKLLRMSYAAAWELLHKVRLVLAAQLPEQTLLAPCELFVKVFLRRSLESTKHSHPSTDTLADAEREAQSEQPIEQVQVECNLQEQFPAENFSDTEAEVYSWLDDKPVSIDTLLSKQKLSIGQIIGALGILELNGLVLPLANGYYSRKPVKAKIHFTDNCAPKAVIREIIGHIKRFHGGVSRKYIQLYLVPIWCAIDKKRWGNNAVLFACLKHPPIKRADILAYASPPNLKLGF